MRVGTQGTLGSMLHYFTLPRIGYYKMKILVIVAANYLMTS